MMIVTLISSIIKKSKQLLTLCLRNKTLSRCIWRNLNNITLWIWNLISIGIGLAFVLVFRWIPKELVALVHSVSKHVAMSAQRPVLLITTFITRVTFGINIHSYWIRFWCEGRTMSNAFVRLFLENQSLDLVHWWKWLRHENLTPHSLKFSLSPIKNLMT